MAKEKIKAVSMYRYRGGAREKRLYGGQGTITEFWVYFDDEKEPLRVMGHGPTPGDRKTYAIEKAKQIRSGQLTQLRLSENPAGDGALGFILGAGFVAGIVWWLLSNGKSAQAAPAPGLPSAPSKCATQEQLLAFLKKKNIPSYFPVATPGPWPAPSAAEWSSGSRVYSTVDCNLYFWNGTAWYKDTVLSAELAKSIPATLSGSLFVGLTPTISP